VAVLAGESVGEGLFPVAEAVVAGKANGGSAEGQGRGSSVIVIRGVPVGDACGSCRSRRVRW